MNVTKLKLRDFRNYQNLEIGFDPGVNLIVGDNAQGKTNMLEALIYLGSGKSFRTQKSGELVRFGADFADISGMEGPFGQNTEGEVLWCSAKLSFDEGGQGKIVWFDVVPGILYSLRAESGASADMLQNMAVQLFEPVQDNS